MQAPLVTPQFWRRALTWAGYVAAALFVLYIASRIPRTLTVFAIASFIAAGVIPLVRRLHKIMPRIAAIAIVYTGLIGAFAAIVLLVVPATFDEVQSLGANTPSYIIGTQAALAHVEATLRAHFGHSYLPPGYSSLSDYFTAQLISSMNVVLGSLTGVFVATANAFFVAISALVLSAFFVTQGRGITEALYLSLAPDKRVRARAFGRELGRVFVGFVAGQALLCAVTGIAIFAFSEILGFRFALLLGIFCGIAYAVPFVGMVAAQVVAALLALPQGGTMVVWETVIVFVVARVADNLLVPKIMSDSVGVSPIVVMFSVFAGGELFGLPGLVLGIPAAALARVAWKFIRHDDEVPAPATVTVTVKEETVVTVQGPGEAVAEALDVPAGVGGG